MEVTIRKVIRNAQGLTSVKPPYSDMYTSKKLIDELMTTLEISQNKAAKYLGTTRSGVGHWYHEERIMNDVTAVKAAELLGFSQKKTEALLICLAWERAEKPADKKLWLGIFKGHYQNAIAASALLLLPLFEPISSSII